MKNKDRSFSYCNNHRRQSSKRFCSFCKRFGRNIETCYHCNKSTASISTATIANTESVQPMAPVSTQSKSSGRTFTISIDDLKNIIAIVIRMIVNHLIPLLSQFYLVFQLGKQSALPFNTSESISTDIFDLIHSDVWWPSSVFSIGGSQYFVVFVDDYSHYN